MKQLLENPIMINIELGLAQDLLKILGAAIHPRFSHDEIGIIKDLLKKKIDEADKVPVSDIKSQ